MQVATRAGRTRSLFSSLCAVLLLAPLLGCSAQSHRQQGENTASDTEHDPLFGSDEEQAPSGFPDPLEPVNRQILRINEQVDRWLLDPLTRLYRFVVPDIAKHGLRNAINNVDSPVVMANDVFQLELHDFAVTTWRLMINTSVGLGGLIDVGEYLGVEGHSSDFDQTLAIYGVPSGAYLILPLLGPYTVRGTAGFIVDLLFRPTAYFLGPADQLTFTIIHGGGYGLTAREQHYDDLKSLHDTAVDYYAALRNAYYQNRMGEIWRRYPQGRPPQ